MVWPIMSGRWDSGCNSKGPPYPSAILKNAEFEVETAEHAWVHWRSLYCSGVYAEVGSLLLT